MSSAKLRNACGTSVAALILNVMAARASVEISAAPTMNMNCSAGVCAPTAKSAVLNVNDLTAMLSSTDITVKTGNHAVTIGIVSPFAWASPHRLSLDANLNVNIKAQVLVEGTAGLTIVTNDGGSGGDLMFGSKGNVKFWDTGSSLVINGQNYTLVNSIGSLASAIAANPSGFYALANDYDASADGTYTTAPVATEFGGTFEGLNHRIDHMKIVATESLVGLFAVAGGTLRDIQVTNASIRVNAGNGGVLLGGSNNDGVAIVGCSVSGTMVFQSGPGAGGLIGSGKGSIELSRADVDVKVGEMAFAGGLVGETNGLDISRSYARGSVKGGDNSFIGGLVGGGGGTIANSYATGAVSGPPSAIIGGLVGGAAETSVASSYSIGLVKGKGAGGFLGAESGGDLQSDYWDVDTSHKGRKNGCGNRRCPRSVQGLTTAEFQSGLPSGFDPAIWAQSAGINNGYPYLIANPPH